MSAEPCSVPLIPNGKKPPLSMRPVESAGGVAVQLLASAVEMNTKEIKSYDGNWEWEDFTIYYAQN